MEHGVDSIAGEAIKSDSRLGIEKDCGVFRCILLCPEKSETRDRKPVPSKDSHEDLASFNFLHRSAYRLHPQRGEIIPQRTEFAIHSTTQPIM